MAADQSAVGPNARVMTRMRFSARKTLQKEHCQHRCRYMTTVMANDWIAAKKPIDDTTRKCWMQFAEKKQ